MLRNLIPGVLLAVATLCFIRCNEEKSNPVTAPVARLITVGEFNIPENADYEYRFSDGSTLISSSFVDLGDGKKGMLMGAFKTDTVVFKGNSCLIGYYYSNGTSVVFGDGAGIVLEPTEIKDGYTYTASGIGYNRDHSNVLKMDISVKFTLVTNIPVGAKMIDEALFVETTTKTARMNGFYFGESMKTSDYRGKGLGTLKAVNVNGETLRYSKKIVVNGVTVFTS
jgi:hypothetical protein